MIALVDKLEVERSITSPTQSEIIARAVQRLMLQKWTLLPLASTRNVGSRLRNPTAREILGPPTQTPPATRPHARRQAPRLSRNRDNIDLPVSESDHHGIAQNEPKAQKTKMTQ